MTFTDLIRIICAASVLAPLGGAHEPVHAHTDTVHARLLARNRSTWGIVPGTSAHPDQPQADGEPRDGLPSSVQARIAAMQISQKPMTDLVRKFETMRRKAIEPADRRQREINIHEMRQERQKLSREAATRSLLRNIYSPDQMREQMTWFWMNHFNVYARKYHIEAMLGDYENTIRDHALGRFRDLLEVTLKHPAMLSYLDNNRNVKGHINENYAREIMELHTMGVGSGYTQSDVQELARILTGTGIQIFPEPPHLRPGMEKLYIQEGLFEFNPARHDFGSKQFLGHTIAGTGFDEVEKALDLIASSPATAKYVSGRIATFMMGQTPPPQLVARMVAAWQASDGDIPTVLDAMSGSPEYKASLGQGFKDPMHYVVSAVRYTYPDQVIRNAGPLIYWLKRMGQGLYNCPTPDGYPLEPSAWTGASQMATRLEFARAMAGGADQLFTEPGKPVSTRRGPPGIRDAAWEKALGSLVSEQTHKVLAQARDTREWDTLLLASPDFMRR